MSDGLCMGCDLNYSGCQCSCMRPDGGEMTDEKRFCQTCREFQPPSEFTAESREMCIWCHREVERKKQHERSIFESLRRRFAVAIIEGAAFDDMGGLAGGAPEELARASHILATECARVWAELDAAEEKA